MDEKSTEEYTLTSQCYSSSPRGGIGVVIFSSKKKTSNVPFLQKIYGSHSSMPCFRTTIIIQEDKCDYIMPITNNIEPIKKNIIHLKKEETNNDKIQFTQKSENNIYNVIYKKNLDNANLNNNKDIIKCSCNLNDNNKLELPIKDKNDDNKIKNFPKKYIHKNKSELTTIKKNESKSQITRSRTLRGNKKKAKKKKIHENADQNKISKNNLENEVRNINEYSDKNLKNKEIVRLIS